MGEDKPEPRLYAIQNDNYKAHQYRTFKLINQYFKLTPLPNDNSLTVSAIRYFTK